MAERERRALDRGFPRLEASDALGRDAVPPEEEEEVEPCAAPLVDPVRPRVDRGGGGGGKKRPAAEAARRLLRRARHRLGDGLAEEDHPRRERLHHSAAVGTAADTPNPPLERCLRFERGIVPFERGIVPFVDLTLPLRAPPPSRRTRQPRLRANPDAVRASREPRDERERGESDRRRRRRPGQAVAGAQARSNRALVSVEPRVEERVRPSEEHRGGDRMPRRDGPRGSTSRAARRRLEVRLDARPGEQDRTIPRIIVPDATDRF